MKTFAILILGTAVLLAGCDSMSSRMSDRFSTVPPKKQVFQGDQAAVLAAALQAFKRLDFVVTRSSPARIDAVSRINSSVAFGDSRQLVVGLHLNAAGPGKTEVELTLTQSEQSQYVGGTSQKELREHSFFGLYYATLQQVLSEDAAAAAVRKD
jgi:hypothetical protein